MTVKAARPISFSLLPHLIATQLAAGLLDVTALQQFLRIIPFGFVGRCEELLPLDSSPPFEAPF